MQVHITSHCEVAGLRLASEGRRLPVAPNGEAAALPVLPAGPGPEAPVPAKHGSPGRPRDPNTCFFEGQQRPHGARWSPNYDPLCSLCTCQVGCLDRAQMATGSGARGPSASSKPWPLSTETDSDLRSCSVPTTKLSPPGAGTGPVLSRVSR